MDKSIKPTGITYGVYLGIILSLITVVVYVIDLAIFAKWWYGILNFLILLAVSIMAVTKAKSLKSTYFTFKEAFSTYFITVVIGTLISSAVSLLLFNVIDPQAAGHLMELTIEATRNMLENLGVPEADIQEAITKLEGENQFSPGNYLIGYIYSLAVYAVVGLIIGLIFKEKNPENYNA